MIDKICDKIAIFMIKKQNGNIPFEVYRYGLQLIMSSIGTAIFIVCMSCICDTFLMGLLYLVVYIPLKVTCGGYHSKTVIGCFFISIINYFSVVILAKSLSALQLPIWIWLVLLGINVIFIAISAPVKNKRHNVGKSIIRKNKKYSLVMIFTLSMILLLCYVIWEATYILNYVVLTIASIAIGILFTKEGGKTHVRFFN